LGTQDQVGIDGGGGWVVVKGRYAAPSSYQKVLLRLQEDLQMRMQNLLLGDLDAAPDEATPPKYQEFVERYYEVLSRERGGGSVRTPAAAPPP
jgi:hypothetical protein